MQMFLIVNENNLKGLGVKCVCIRNVETGSGSGGGDVGSVEQLSAAPPATT